MTLEVEEIDDETLEFEDDADSPLIEKKFMYIRGEGGHVFKMALPLPDTIRQRLEKGLIKEAIPKARPPKATPATVPPRKR